MKRKGKQLKYNILYLNPFSVISGAETSLLLLLKNLNREFFNPIVVLPNSGPLKHGLEEIGIEIVTMALSKINIKNPIPYLKTVNALTRIIRNKDIDIVHCNMDICNQYALVAAKLRGVPIICHTRNMLAKRPFRRMFLGYANVLIANSRAVAASYASYVSKSQKVVVIHNGVDLNEFSPTWTKRGLFRRKLGIPDEAFVIGHIARICPEKGQHSLIDAMAQITKNHSKVYALIAGDTAIDDSAAFLTSLKQLVLKYELAERVVFIGFVDNIIDLYVDLDLVVLPSLCEPFGRTLIEAMSMEKPVIASGVGGPLEIVENEVTGFLISPNDPAQLAETILKVLRDKELGKKMGENGREQVKRFFAIEENVRKTEEVYLHLLQNQDK